MRFLRGTDRLSIITIDYANRYNIGNYHLNAELASNFKEVRYYFLENGFSLDDPFLLSSDMIFINRPLRKTIQRTVEGETYRKLNFKSIDGIVVLFDTDPQVLSIKERAKVIDNIGVDLLLLGNNDARVVEHNRFFGGRILCKWLPFGVNLDHFYDMGIERDIVSGFIGSYRNYYYGKRKEMVEYLREKLGNRFFWKRMIKEEYLLFLNRIKLFVLANDLTGGFFMKHLESMASGCLLVAEYTPLLERLGFVPSEDLIVWNTLQECEQAILYYAVYEGNRGQIIENAKKKIKEHHTWAHRVKWLLTWASGKNLDISY